MCCVYVASSSVPTDLSDVEDVNISNRYVCLMKLSVDTLFVYDASHVHVFSSLK